MASRLDRLFILLEAGSSSSTRRAAASQLGAVQKLHPHELPQLLQRVHKCLRSPLWETRIAGGQAVEAILSQVPVWQPPSKPPKEVKFDPTINGNLLTFANFSVNNILDNGHVQFLMGSEGTLFDRETEDPQNQRALINQKLGLDIAEKIGIDTSDMFSNEDLDAGDANMSSREVNLAKRRARKQKSRENDSSDNKKVKNDDSIELNFGEGDFYEKCLEEGRWPLERWVDVLITDLFSSAWEVRHGSATALREVIRLHGKTACRQFSSAATTQEAQTEYLIHIALSLVRVLLLDRFGDFISDQVVAPVRETVAQCLGTTISLMPDDCVHSIVRMLVELLEQKAWEVRHGGLLALKYSFAVRSDLIHTLLPYSFPSIFKCLQDSVDDVCAVAASALIPVVEDLARLMPAETPRVVNVLWDSLNTLDDLSSACNTIMGLLAGLLAYPAGRSELKSLDTLLPRLWPFLHHTSSSVRKSALMTLQKLTDLDKTVEPLSVDKLQLTLRHTFQRALTEHNLEVLALIPSVWVDLLRSSELNTLLIAACPMIGVWLFLAMQHPRLGVDPQYLVSTGAVAEKRKLESSVEDKVFISGIADGNPERVAKTRFILTQMLGRLTPYIVQPLEIGPASDPLDHFARLILHHLNTRSALQRTVAALVISSWTPKPKDLSHPALQTRLLECLNESVYYEEIAYNLTKLQADCRDFISTLKHYNVNMGDYGPYLSFDEVEKLTDESAEDAIMTVVRKSKLLDTLLERKRSIANLCRATRAEFGALTITTQSSLAAALVSLQLLPPKLNPVVKPLMDSIRREENELFQRSAADHLCHLMELVLDRDPCPVPKIVQNITGFLCSDSSVQLDSLGIVTLTQLSLDEKKGASAETPLSVQRRGASYALTAIVKYFGVQLPAKVGRLWELTFGILTQIGVEESRPAELRKVTDALEILEIISPQLHPDLFPQVMDHLPRAAILLSHQSAAVRHMTSRTLAVWAQLIPEQVMPMIVTEILPRLESQHEIVRMGGIEAIWCIVEKLGLDLLPYIVLLVVPVLGRMSDADIQIRTLASLTFATLVRLMPLEGGVPDPPNLPAELLQHKQEQRLFLEQLLTPTKIPEFKITVPIKATLRPYQQAGVNWLGFLNKFRLHGILCDDMGLGKTLQSICIMASGDNPTNLPSIVICPPTLTGHWVYEIEQFISKEHLNPLHYHGPPVERNKLKPRLSSHNLVVASYDIVRNDIDFFSSVHWNYCVLDEGHIIKNGKTKISLAIKQLKSNHRLILSGTPIQNNVLELWSLFDFLMPGFLGTEKQFQARFGRPILLARDSKSSPKDQEAGALAMESLHRQALPFLLRRLKEDVLQDLPPKITQDYYCELSPIQEQLYEDFARTRAHQSLRDTFGSVSDDAMKHSHIFQALQYLRKVCNHPKLVLTPQHPKYASIMEQVESSKSTLDNIIHSAKLPALKQLLLDCGIGVNESNNSSAESIQVVNQHRALIFCQLKSMLDILENDLFKAHMQTVTYLRLDGSVPAGQRHALVTRFNNDPSIDILLLTTQVGGLGLNLTGADTVIFVEHDWNPMRDLQAMDRAHRIGQKKVVNVYRLITRGTLEEKIMGLQKFKLMTANTVITQDNACIETMATDQLLDLFVLDEGNSSSSENKTKDSDSLGIVGAYKNVLENIPDLWDDKLYDDEYDLSSFIKNLGK